MSARFSFHDGNVGRTVDHPITTLQHTVTVVTVLPEPVTEIICHCLALPCVKA